VAYLVESNKFQVWANARGDEAKRERKFLGGRRVVKSSLFGRSSHGTCVERRRSRGLQYIPRREKGTAVLVGWSNTKGLYPSRTTHFHWSERPPVVHNCVEGGKMGQYWLFAGGTGMLEGISSRWLGGSGIRFEAPSRQLLIDAEL